MPFSTNDELVYDAQQPAGFAPEDQVVAPPETPRWSAPAAPEPTPAQPQPQPQGNYPWNTLRQVGAGIVQGAAEIPAGILGAQAASERIQPIIAGKILGIGDEVAAQPNKFADALESSARYFNRVAQHTEEDASKIGGWQFARKISSALTSLVPYIFTGAAAPILIGEQVFGQTYLNSKDAYKAKYPNDDPADTEIKAAATALPTAIGSALIWHYVPKIGGKAVGADLVRAGTEGVNGVILNTLKHMGITGTAATTDTLQQELIAKATYNPDKPIADIISDAVGSGAGMAALTGLVGGAAGGVHEYRAGQARAERMATLEELKASPERSQYLKQRGDIMWLQSHPELGPGNLVEEQTREILAKNEVPPVIPQPRFSQNVPVTRGLPAAPTWWQRQQQEAIGGINASSVTGTEGVGFQREGEGVGPTPPFRQQRQAAPPGATEVPPPPGAPPPPVAPKPPHLMSPRERHPAPDMEGDQKTATESITSILARTSPGPERENAFSERAKAAVRLANTLRPGDKVVEDDGSEWTVDTNLGNGDFFTKESEGGAVNLAIHLMEGQGRNAKDEPIFIPPGKIVRGDSAKDIHVQFSEASGHRKELSRAMTDRAPLLNAEAVEAYGMEKMAAKRGYVKEGDHYVYKSEGDTVKAAPVGVLPDVAAAPKVEAPPPKEPEPRLGLSSKDFPAGPVAANEVALKPDLMQYLPYTGAGVAKKHKETIAGEWDPRKATNILVWEPKPENREQYGLTGSQKYIVANGHGRVNYGLEKGVKWFNVQVMREADGFSAKDARMSAALINIAEGKGSIYDDAKFLRDTAAVFGKDAAVARAAQEGITGRNSATIAFSASEPTYTAFLNRKVTDQQAVAISDAAPNNDAVQQVALELAVKRAAPEELRGLIESMLSAQKSQNVPKANQLDFFANTGLQDVWKRQAVYIAQRRRAIQDIIDTRKSAVEKYDAATRSGSITVDLERAKAEYDQATAELERWKKWAEDPELRAEVTKAGEGEKKEQPKPPLPPEVKPEPPAKSPQEIAAAESARKVKEALKNILDIINEPEEPGAFSGAPLKPEKVDRVVSQLVVVAREGSKYGYHKFVQTVYDAYGKAKEVWEKIRPWLHAAWSGAAATNPDMTFEDILREDAAKVLERVESGAPEATPAARPVSELNPATTKARYEMLRQQLDAYFERKGKTIAGFKRRTFQNPEYVTPAKLAFFMATDPRYQSFGWENLNEALIDDFKTWLFSMEGRKEWAKLTGSEKELKAAYSQQTADTWMGALRRWVGELESRTPLGQRPGERLSRNEELFKWRGEVSSEEGEKSPPIEEPEMRKLLVEPPPDADLKRVQSWALAELLYSTGFRPSVIGRLKLNQLDLKNGWLEKVQLGFKKGAKKVSHQLLSDRAQYAMARYLREVRPKLENAKTDWLFPSEGDPNRGIPPGTITSHIKYLSAKTGALNVEGSAPGAYAFRRSLITHLRDIGLPPHEYNAIVPHEAAKTEGESKTTLKSYLSRTTKWMETIGRKINLLPLNQEFLARQKPTEPFVPPAAALRRKPKESGPDLLANLPAEPFKLVQETGPDVERLTREKAAKEAARIANEKFQKENQVLLGLSATRVPVENPVTPGELRQIADKEKTFGFKVNIVSHAEAAKYLLDKSGGEFILPDNQQGFFTDGKIWLLHDRITTDDAHAVIREEAAHGLLSTPEGNRLRLDAIAEGKLRVTDAELQSIRDIDPEYAKMSRDDLINEFIAKSARENRTWWQNIVEAVKRFLSKFGLKLDSEEASRVLLNQIARANDKNLRQEAMDVAGISKVWSSFKPTKEEFRNAQLDYAANEVARKAEAGVKYRLAARTSLESLAFDTKAYRDAVQKINEMVLEARRLAARNPNPKWRDAKQAPKFDDPMLAQKLQELQATGENIDLANAIGSPPINPDTVRALQQEVLFEQESRAQYRRGEILKRANESIDYLKKFGFEPKDYEKLDKIRYQIIRAMTRASARPDMPNANRLSIDERAQQMLTAEQLRPNDKALSDSLDLPWVRETFVDPLAEGENLVQKFKQHMLDFNRAMADPKTTDAFKRAIATKLLTNLQLFDANRINFEKYANARRAEIVANIRQLTSKLADVKLTYGMAEYLVQDALKVADGKMDEGNPFLGRPISREEAGFFRESYGAIMAFAEGLREKFPGSAETVLSNFLNERVKRLTNYKDLLDEIVAGRDPEVNELRGVRVSDEVLAKAIYVLGQAKPVRDAVGALLRYGEMKLGRDPTDKMKVNADISNQLREITDLIAAKEPARRAEGQERLAKIVARAKDDKTASDAAMKYVERNLDSAQIALRALDYGRELFDSVTTRTIEPSRVEPVKFTDDQGNEYTATNFVPAKTEPNPEYEDMRRKAEGITGYEERKIVTTGGSAETPGGTTTTFKGFKVNNDDVKIEQPTFALNAGADIRFDPYLNESNFLRIQSYFDNAEKYVAAYDQAVEEWKNGSGKSPEALGFDPTEYRGLKRAIEEYKGTYQDATILFLGNKAHNNMAEQWMMQSKFFRQYLHTAKQVNGQTAREFQSLIVRYGNGLGTMKRISNDHRYDYLEKRSAAINSHPELGGDLQIYGEQVFNQLASEGRKFGSDLKVGTKLPEYGQTVTKEDMDFLREQQSYYDDLRSEVTEKFGRGIQKQVRTPEGDYRLMIRKAATTGDYGLPMHIGIRGAILMRDIQKAYKDAREMKVKPPAPVPPEGRTSGYFGPEAAPAETNGLPTVATDMGPSSTNPVVQFWNRRVRSLTRHILDAGRAYRAVSQDRFMEEAEKAAAAELKKTNDSLRIQNLEDMISFIVEKFPKDTGIDDVRSYVTENLLDELSQYERNANIIAPEMAEYQANEGIGGMAVRSEFTAPASQFMFPSTWYDFGAVTNTDILHLTARSMHEPIIELAKGMQRMSAALASEIKASLESRDNRTSYSNRREAERLKKVIDALLGDFRKSWNLSDPDVNRGTWEFPPDVIKASLLANLPVNVRNVVLGSTMAFIDMARLHHFSGMVAMLYNLRYVGKIAASLPVDILFSPNSKFGRKMDAALRGPIKSILPSAIYEFAQKIVDSHINNVKEVQRLGFSLRNQFTREVAALWRDLNVYQTTSEAQRASNWMTLRRGIRNVAGTVMAAYRLVGSEYGDKLINSQALGLAGGTEARLRDVAMSYGEARKELGERNAADERWLLKPNEFSDRLTYAGRSKNLAEFRKFIVGADIDLESVLWRYYKEMKAAEGTDAAPSPLKPEEFDNLKRAWLRAANAGDALNRPTGQTVSKLFRLLATFQGWTSSFLLSFMAQVGGAKDQGLAKRLAMSMPQIAAYAVAAATVGLLSQQMTDWYKQHFQRATRRQVTLLSKEFWNNWDNAKDALISAEFSTIPLLGDLALFMRGTVINNRGYEPTGRILSFGIMNSMFNAIRGMWNLRNDPNPMNMLNPLRDFIVQYAGFGREGALLVGKDYGAVKEMSGAVGAARYKVDQLGLSSEREQGNVKPGIFYSQASGIHEDMTAAMMRQDPAAFEQAYANLVKFYSNKGMEDPEKNAQRDVRVLNPIVRSFYGKKPTQEEYDKVYSAMTSDQRAALDKASAAWEWGASQVGINFNPILAGERGAGGAGGAGGGGGAAYVPYGAAPAGPATGGGGGGLYGRFGLGAGRARVAGGGRLVSYPSYGRVGRMRRTRLTRRGLRIRSGLRRRGTSVRRLRIPRLTSLA